MRLFTLILAGLALMIASCDAKPTKKETKAKAAPTVAADHRCPAGMERVPQGNANVLACRIRQAACPEGLVEVSQANGVLACKLK